MTRLGGIVNRNGVVAGLLVSGVAAVCAAQPDEKAAEPMESPVAIQPAQEDDRGGEIKVSQLRLREGSQVENIIGRFQRSGESLTFVDEDNRELGGLPNLNLERILRMLKTTEEPETVWWSVSGTVTEFSGRNYLLISRAVYKSAAPPPAPESLPNVAAAAAPTP